MSLNANAWYAALFTFNYRRARSAKWIQHAVILINVEPL